MLKLSVLGLCKSCERSEVTTRSVGKKQANEA